MSVLKLEKIVSFSSESKKHPSSNLLHGGPSNDSNKKWLAQSAAEDKAFVVIKLQKPSSITAIDIGNDGSAFIEVLVSNDRKEFVRLLPSSSFMSPMESRMNETRNRIRSFSRFESESADKSWSYVKFVCSQPYNKNWPFGMVFVAVRGATEEGRVEAGKAEPASARTHPVEPNDMDGSPEARNVVPNRETEIDCDETHEPQGKYSRPSGSPRKPDNGNRENRKKKALDGVVVVLSGFQNPLRSQLRDMALSMGAKYRPDWSPGCTHLVSAFSNTPKWSQVAASGGRIVTKEWLEECQKLQQKLPWKQFKCGKYRDKVQDTAEQQNSDQDASEEEDIADDGSEYDPGDDKMEDSDGADEPSGQRQREKLAQNPPPTPQPLPDDLLIEELKNIFRGKRFFLESDIYVSEEKDTLRRYIVGHGGVLCPGPESAEYVISWKAGARSPLWVVKCHQENRIVDE